MAKLDTLNETLLELQGVVIQRMQQEITASEMVIGTVRNILKDYDEFMDVSGMNSSGKLTTYADALKLAIKAYDIATEEGEK